MKSSGVCGCAGVVWLGEPEDDVCAKCHEPVQWVPTVETETTTYPPTTLPTDSAERKDVPLARGVLDYFPAALAAVAQLSKVGNDKHNPGEDLHWARGKSMDHADCIMRHLLERGTEDTDGILHDVKVAWRALAMLQEELERRGAPRARGRGDGANASLFRDLERGPRT